MVILLGWYNRCIVILTNSTNVQYNCMHKDHKGTIHIISRVHNALVIVPVMFTKCTVVVDQSTTLKLLDTHILASMSLVVVSFNSR